MFRMYDRPVIGAMIRRSSAAAYELWMLFPVWLLAYRHGMPDVFHGPWLAAAVGLSLLGACASVWRPYWLLHGAAALAIAAVAVWATGGGVWSIAGGALLFLGLMQGATVLYRYRKAGWLWLGVAVSFAASVAVQIGVEWNSLAVPILAGGIVNLGAALFVTNHRHLNNVSLAGDNSRSVSGEMKRHNRVFVAFLLGVLLALAAGLGGLLTHLLLRTAAAAIRLFLKLVSSPGPAESSPAPEPLPTETPLLPEPSEPGRLAGILNFIFYAFGTAIVALLVFWGLRYLYRNHRGIWRRWIDRLAALLRSRPSRLREASGFTDEETSLFSWEETLGRFRKYRIGRVLTGYREPRFEDFAGNREKVRFLYRLWLRALSQQGYRVHPDLTPLETARDAERWRQAQPDAKGMRVVATEDEQALIELYHRARYREEEPADEQLNAVRSKFS